MLFISILISVVFIVIGVSVGIQKLAAVPTAGARISDYPNPQKALLIIDVQNDSLKHDFKNTEAMIAAINQTIAKAASAGWEIIYIKTEYPCYGYQTHKIAIPFGHNTPGAEIDRRIKIASDNIFTKWKGDAMSNKELNDFLISKQINELYLTGVDGLQCVLFTLLGALNRGYKVHVIREAIDFLAPKNFADAEVIFKRSGADLIDLKEFIK
jgi:nicotinamidase-related amidase